MKPEEKKECKDIFTVELTEEEEQYAELLEGKLAGGAGALIYCSCQN